jgi:hypothetical protein
VAQTKDAGDAGAANKNDPAHSGGQSSGPASGTNVKPSQGPATGGNPGQPGLPGNKSGPPARPSGSDSPRR